MSEHTTKPPQVGPWEVRSDRAHCGTPFYKLVRRNPAWTGYHFGQETALTPKGAVRRFYDKVKAEAEVAKRNAALSQGEQA